MSQKSEFVNEIIQLIVDAVNLHHVDPAKLKPETSLREGGLELDSVDILEVIVAIEHKYGVKLQDAETGRTHFRTLGSIASWVESQQQAVR